MFDYLIIGSGAAGVAAAYELRSKNVLMLDVGIPSHSQKLPDGNFYDLKKSGLLDHELIFGKGYNTLQSSLASVSLKLKRPLFNFVNETPPCAPVDALSSFNTFLSYARGGLANAWGAGVFRFNDSDLKYFPYSYSDLLPHYKVLNDIIGISGTTDDLYQYLGNAENLLPPLRLSGVSDRVLQRYHRRRHIWEDAQVTLGRLHLAILSQNYKNRTSYSFENKDFFEQHDSIYNPQHTLNALLEKNEIQYLPGHLVESYVENDTGITVHARNIIDKGYVSFLGAKLIIATGAINSARLVLASNKDCDARIPILDNPVSFTPFIFPRLIGTALEKDSFSSGELLVVDSSSDEAIQGTFYNLNGPLRADLLKEFPLSMRGNIIASKYLLPAIGVLQSFYPNTFSSHNFMQRRSDGSLHIEFTNHVATTFEQKIIRLFRSIGGFAHRSLIKIAKPGDSIHYAGTLPMTSETAFKYTTEPSGRLRGTKNIFIVDASTFPHLPSKNFTLTIMANAMRIASYTLASNNE